ncbi:MAG: insulinase family protein [Propionibacteriales bacterium]|nr:insulinase family protein [Propionibacteriales bacterium]
MSADVVNYPLHQEFLSNGLRVLVSPDRSVPVAAVNLWYDVGSRDELPGQYGWAHLFEHLMFSGSARVASGEHLQLLQNLGGSVNATTWFDRTNYFETLPIGALDLALWLEADRLGSLADHLTIESVDTQREVVKEEKRQRYDNVPYGDAMATLVELVFGADHHYGHTTIGTMEDLAGASVEAAADFFRTHYRPENAVLTLVGDFTVKEAFRKAERAFGQLRGGARRQRPVPGGLAPMEGIPAAELSGRVPAEAAYLAWRLPVRDTVDFDAADLALGILGGGQSSRLHQLLVRERRLLAFAGAHPLPLIGGNSIGLIQLRGLPDRGVAEGVQATLEQVERLATDGPTEDELNRIKAQFGREWLMDLARLDTRADLISAFTVLHDDPGRVNRRLVELTSITAAQVRDAAATLLRPEHRAELIYRVEASR